MTLKSWLIAVAPILLSCSVHGNSKIGLLASPVLKQALTDAGRKLIINAGFAAAFVAWRQQDSSAALYSCLVSLRSE